MKFVDINDDQKAESVFREHFAPHYGAVHRAMIALPGLITGHDGCDISSYPKAGGWGIEGLSELRDGEWDFRIFWLSDTAEERHNYGYFRVKFADDGSVLSFGPEGRWMANRR